MGDFPDLCESVCVCVLHALKVDVLQYVCHDFIRPQYSYINM